MNDKKKINAQDGIRTREAEAVNLKFTPFVQLGHLRGAQGGIRTREAEAVNLEFTPFVHSGTCAVGAIAWLLLIRRNRKTQ